MHIRCPVAAVMLAAVSALPLLATEPTDAEAEFFERHIRPLLSNRCHECHGAEVQEAELRLDSLSALLAGGTSGAAAVMGDVEGSLLLKAIRYDNPALQMPPDGKLSKRHIALVEQWVAMGLPWPGGDDPLPPANPRHDPAAQYDQWKSSHWAFQPVADVSLPTVRDTAWVRSPVDRFILARLESEGLPPAPQADRRALLRRVSFDLTGLPPTPDEIEAFLADDSPQAFERVVDRLLASPAYSQRWARHWLDVVRFAETNGFNRDPDKPHMWRYRDYVIEALNDDLPYDRFVIEQLAGDLLPPRPTADGRRAASTIATGMLWSSELVYNPIDPEEQRADQVDAQLDVIGKGLLGLTITCARCHDHKFDPIPTRDYYALAGILHSAKGVIRPVELGAADPVPAVAAQRITPLELHNWLFDAVDAPRRAEVQRAAEYMLATAPLLQMPRDRALAQVDDIARRHGLRADIVRQWVVFANLKDGPDNPNVGPWINLLRDPQGTTAQRAARALARKPSNPNIRAINPLTRAALEDPASDSLEAVALRFQQIMLDVIAAKRYGDPVHKQWLNWFHRPDTPFTAELFASQLAGDQRAKLAALRAQVTAQSPAPAAQAMAAAEADDPRFEVFQVRLASFPNAWSLPREMAVADIRLHRRGRFDNLGEVVPRGVLTALPGHESFYVTTGSGRLELARWIASPENPLTARVLVNRLWQHHFGRGLVDTPDNFGLSGSRPTHPELLDWLAGEFVRQGWSLKAMHRLMVLSSTYRMSSTPEQQSAQRDPDNQLLHAMPLRRLEAEAVRDAVLAVCGGLNPAMGGPGEVPYITPFMYPRFQPQGGVVDGHGRRSIYITVRRNFLTPLLLAFDFPLPSEPVGRRETSILPTQALAMLNSEFVHQQAAHWGSRLAAEAGSPEQRIDGMFLRALARPASVKERAAMLGFLDGRTGDPAAWTDLAHVLLNTSAFVFVR